MAPNRRGRPPGARAGSPDPIDIHVGRRIKLRRTLLRISQEQLAGDIGVTFQQVQKYESGHNRVSASRLFDISRVLDCPISYFFEDIGDEVTSDRPTPNPRTSEGLSESQEGFDDDPMNRTETLELVRAYWRLHNTELRRNVLDLLINMSKRE
jgi:transcriptional regulator with XRE-family HTH domain